MKTLILTITVVILGAVGILAQTKSVVTGKDHNKIVAPTNLFEINFLLEPYFLFTRQASTTAVVSLSLDITNAVEDVNPVGSTDYVLAWSANSNAIRKILLDNLPGSGSGSFLELEDSTASLELEN